MRPRDHVDAILIFWLVPGWLLGAAAGVLTCFENGLELWSDESAWRLCVAAAAAVSLEGLLAGTLLAALLAMAGPLWGQVPRPTRVHALVALASWGAWASWAPTLLSSKSPNLVLALRLGALFWLVAAPIAASLLLRRVGRFPEAIASNSPLRIGSAAVVGTTLGVFLLVVVGLPGLSWSEASGEPEDDSAAEAAAPGFQPHPTGLGVGPERSRVFLIGVDGLDWDLLEPVLEAGEAPNLARMRREGAWAPLETLEPTWSPRLWNTVLTGRSPESHGVEAFSVVGYPRLGIAGIDHHRLLMVAIPVLEVFDRLRHVPVSSLSRRVKALWNVASEAGLEVAVLGAWASYPAEPVRGVLVSDHAFYRPEDFAERRSGRRVSRSDWGLTYPTALVEELSRYQTTLEEASPEVLEPFVRLTPDDRARFEEKLAGDAEDEKKRLRMMTWAVLADRFYGRSTLHVLETLQPDFLFTYFRVVDGFGHMVFEFSRPEAAAHEDPGDVARFGQSMRQAVRFVNQWVGRILEEADDRTAVVVVSDHGWEQEGTEDGKPVYAHNRAPPGLLLASGHGIRAAGRLDGIGLADVAPTVLYLLGLPVAEELDGRVIEELVAPERLRSAPPRRIASYGAERDLEDVVADSAQDDEMVEKLEALGYLE